MVTTIPELMHGSDWIGQSLSGFWLSEKFRGWRVLWDGEKYQTRLGNVLDVPESWLVGMPSIRLDGELYSGRHPHEGPIKSAVARGDWSALTFHVFDVPVSGLIFEDARDVIDSLTLPPHCRKVDHRKVKRTAEAISIMRKIISEGGEGAMCRAARSAYVPYRTNDLLKLKP